MLGLRKNSEHPGRGNPTCCSLPPQNSELAAREDDGVAAHFVEHLASTIGTAQQHASREDTESQAMAGLEERLLLQFLGAGKGKLQGVAPMGASPTAPGKRWEQRAWAPWLGARRRGQLTGGCCCREEEETGKEEGGV